MTRLNNPILHQARCNNFRLNTHFMSTVHPTPTTDFKYLNYLPMIHVRVTRHPSTPANTARPSNAAKCSPPIPHPRFPMECQVGRLCM